MTERLPLLLLHGFLGAPESFAGLEFGKRAVFAPVLLGHRGSEWPSGAAASPMPEQNLTLPTAPSANWALLHGGFEREVDRLAEWARAQHPGPFHLCGYSLGARLGLGLLFRHPSLFTRATLVSVHPGLESEAARAERLALDLDHCRALGEHGVPAFVEGWERLPLFASQSSVAAAALSRQRATRTRHDGRGLVQSLLHCGLAAMPDYGSRLDTLRADLTLLTGELDTKFEQLARGLARRHPAVRWSSLAGAGHNLVLERPRELAQAL